MSGAVPVPVAGFHPQSGPVAGGVEQVVVEGGGGAPVPGDGAFAGGGGRAALEAGARGGALVPPGVVDGGDGVAQLRADRRGVAADERADGLRLDADGAGDAGRAVAHHVQGTQPQPGTAGIHAVAGHGCAGDGEQGGGGVGGGRAAGGQVIDGGWGQAGRGGDAAVGPAALAQPADLLLSGAGAGLLGIGGDRPGRGEGCGAHVSWPARLGDRAGRGRRWPVRRAESRVRVISLSSRPAWRAAAARGLRSAAGSASRARLAAQNRPALRLPSAWLATHRARWLRSWPGAGRG